MKYEKPFIDLTGQRFGMLTVEKVAAGVGSCGKEFWCICDCGKRPIVTSYRLRKGMATNCGCVRLAKEAMNRKRNNGGGAPYMLRREIFE